MVIAERIVVDRNITKQLSLEDLINLKEGFCRYSYKYSHVVTKLIILKKLSNYITDHPNTNLSTLSIGSLIRRIMNDFYDMTSIIKNDKDKTLELEKFYEKCGRTDETRALFFTDMIIPRIERYLDERPTDRI